MSRVVDAPEPPAASWLLRLVDLALLGLIFVAPYFMGGRQPLGQFVFVALIVVAVGAWFARQCLLRTAKWTRSPADWLVPAAVAVVVLQLTPLPAEWISALSPQLAETLPIWSTEIGSQALLTEGASGWSQISVTPSSTAGGLTLLIAYGLLLWVVVQRFQRLCDIERVLCWIASAAVLMAFFGLAQYFFSNGKFMWIYEHPFRDTAYKVKGTFINQNHFAHMLALSIGPMLFWLVRTTQRLEKESFRSSGGTRERDAVVRKVLLLALGLSLITLAMFLSFSRGGAVSFALAVVVACGVMLWLGLVGTRFFAGFAAVGILIGVCLMIYGSDRVTDRLSDLTSGSVEELDNRHGRRKIWEANRLAFQDAPLVGTGVGSHREVYPIYLENPPETEYTHAESGYFQITTETGTLGFGLLILAISVIGWKCLGTPRRTKSKSVHICFAAVVGGLAASVVHSLVDFVWYIPACMTLTVILIGCAFCLRNLADEGVDAKQWTFSRPVWIAATIMVIVCGVGMIDNRVGPALAARHWDAYFRESKTAEVELRKQLRDADDKLSVFNSVNQTDRETEMMRLLMLVMEKDPNHARAHMRLAAHLLRRFEQFQQSSVNPMPLTQIRDAAIASNFESRESMEAWLDKAIGKHWGLLKKAQWHARRGLAISPYQGEGYVYLARLCFLDQQGVEAKVALLDQAVRLRPYDGEVLYRAGNEALLAGDNQAAIDFWKRSFHSDLIDQDRILQIMKGQIRLAELITIFEPNLNDLPRIYGVFKKHNTENQARVSETIAETQKAEFKKDLAFLIAYHKRLAEIDSADLRPSTAARAWMFGSHLNRELERWDEEVACVRRAIEHDQQEFYAHRTLAEALLRAGEYEEAKDVIRWCRNRRPQMARLKAMMEKAEMGLSLTTGETATRSRTYLKK